MVVSGDTADGDTTEIRGFSYPLTLQYDEDGIKEEIEEEKQVVLEEETKEDIPQTDDNITEEAVKEVVEEPKQETDEEIKDEQDTNVIIEEEVTTKEEVTEECSSSETSNEEIPETEAEKTRMEIINETEFIDEKVPSNFHSLPKTVELPLAPGIETGLQIQFTSLKLNTFPIEESNVSSHLSIDETVNLANTNVNIGDFTLYNVGVKIHSYPKFKMVELKTREFRLALSVGLFDKDTLKKEGDYYKYEIFSKLKNSRLESVAKTFKKIFSGEVVSFEINDLKAEISFENLFQYRKFTIVENAVSIYQNISKRYKLNRSKNFSETPISFYTLYLLDQFVHGKKETDTWINFGIDNTKDIKAGDFITFTNIHNLDIRGINFDLKETIKIKEPITEMELSHVKNRVTCYKKTVTITLEKIEK